MAAINTTTAANSNSSSSSAASATAAKSTHHVCEGVGSPLSRRATRFGAWSQIIRGELGPIATIRSSPSAGVGALELTTYGGDEAWPDLDAASSRGSSKSSTDSLKALSDGLSQVRLVFL